jgi:AraC family transcriptional activator of pobA
MKDIPVHQLKERSNLGLDIKRFLPWELVAEEHQVLNAHRDDHYIFFLVDSGSATIMIDFHEITIVNGTLFYVLPGQVHHGVGNDMAGGWFMAVDTLLIPPDCRKVFENQLLLQQPIVLSDVQMRQSQQLFNLLQEKLKEDSQNSFYLPVIHSLLQSFIGIAAGCFSQVNGPGMQLSRPFELSRQFKILLVDHIHTEKSPSAYAALLNVSETYLNEALKKATGLPVSYWILNEVMLEAKRLLFYSNQNVKEIAHTLGYEDHAYFSRLFKKAEGRTPLTFRAAYHK